MIEQKICLAKSKISVLLGLIIMQEITRIEVKTDVYDGKNCDEHRNYFEGHTEGDMGSETISGDITIELSTLPAGSVISIEHPECPECLETPEMIFNQNSRVTGFKDICECGYNWKEFRENEYS